MGAAAYKPAPCCVLPLENQTSNKAAGMETSMCYEEDCCEAASSTVDERMSSGASSCDSLEDESAPRENSQLLTGMHASMREVRHTDAEYDTMGRAFVGAQASNGSHAPMAGSARANGDDEYRSIDCVYEDRHTGGRMYIGSLEAAKDSALLRSLRIGWVVNCQDPESQDYFEGHSTLKYLRFPIAYWHRSLDVDTPAGILNYFEPLFGFVRDVLAAGGNVLIHCLAGVHRAGAAGVAVLMHLRKTKCQDALEYVHQSRPDVDIIFGLKVLLQRLDAAMGHGAWPSSVNA